MSCKLKKKPTIEESDGHGVVAVAEPAQQTTVAGQGIAGTDEFVASEPGIDLAAKTRDVFANVQERQAWLQAQGDATVKAITPEKKIRNIAIVGKAPSSCGLAPYDQANWEIWCLSDLFKVAKRWTHYFELHDPEPRKKKWGDYWVWLQQEHRDEHGNLKPIFMQRHYDEIPNSVPYPKQAVVDRLGDYFTNSVSWMIALALVEGVTELGLWGVDMAQQAVGAKSEYAHQRPSCEYFLGVAVGLGVKVFVHPKSDLMKTWKLYAFDSDPDQFQIKMIARKQELQQQIEDCNRITSEKQQRALVLAGALDNMSWVEEWVSASPERRADVLESLKQAKG